VSAFLTSLYVLFTALLTALRSRSAPHGGLVIGALLATFGAGFIGGPPPWIARWIGAEAETGSSFGLGEALTVGCAFVFALHILVTDAWTKREAPLPVTFTQFAVVAAGSIATLAIAWSGAELAPGASLAALLATRDFWMPLVLSSLLATVLALTLMNLFQRDLDPVRAAIVYAIEPVWAAVFGIALGVEEPTAWLYIGGGALLAGNLVAELVPLWSRRT
jgi:drug/metabolite transporter (DMT)-like permease